MSQSAKPALHAPRAQAPALQLASALAKRQTAPAGHALPQAPQLDRSVVTSTQRPPQVVWLEAHISGASLVTSRMSVALASYGAGGSGGGGGSAGASPQPASAASARSIGES